MWAGFCLTDPDFFRNASETSNQLGTGRGPDRANSWQDKQLRHPGPMARSQSSQRTKITTGRSRVAEFRRLIALEESRRYSLNVYKPRNCSIWQPGNIAIPNVIRYKIGGLRGYTRIAAKWMSRFLFAREQIKRKALMPNRILVRKFRNQPQSGFYEIAHHRVGVAQPLLHAQGGLIQKHHANT